MRIKFHPVHLVVVLFILFVISSLTNKVHGQTLDTAAQLRATVLMYKGQVDSLQALPQMPKRQFFLTVRNLYTARAVLADYTAKHDPDHVLLAERAAEQYRQKALAFAQRAEQN